MYIVIKGIVSVTVLIYIQSQKSRFLKLSEVIIGVFNPISRKYLFRIKKDQYSIGQSVLDTNL